MEVEVEEASACNAGIGAERGRGRVLVHCQSVPFTAEFRSIRNTRFAALGIGSRVAVREVVVAPYAKQLREPEGT